MSNISVEGVILPNESISNLMISDAVDKLKIPNFRGCFCRNDLPKLPHKQECDILNLDDSNGSGTHWVAWYKDNDKKYYFDSYGLTPPTELINYLQSPIYYNSDRIQPDGTVVCGHACLYFLKKLPDAALLEAEPEVPLSELARQRTLAAWASLRATE